MLTLTRSKRNSTAQHNPPLGKFSTRKLKRPEQDKTNKNSKNKNARTLHREPKTHNITLHYTHEVPTRNLFSHFTGSPHSRLTVPVGGGGGHPTWG